MFQQFSPWEAMPEVFVSTVINAPIGRVWNVIRDFNGLPAWMPGMGESLIEGGVAADRIGAVRCLSMAGASEKLRERLEVFSENEHLITYAVLGGPLPVRNTRTSMRLRPITDMHATLGEWSSRFDTEPGEEEQGVEFLKRVFTAGFRQLKRHLNV